MSPTYQTILTLVCMGGAYYWGFKEGKLKGIESAMVYFRRKRYFKEDLHFLYDTDEEYQEDE